jgi:hypothetical protein
MDGLGSPFVTPPPPTLPPLPTTEPPPVSPTRPINFGSSNLLKHSHPLDPAVEAEIAGLSENVKRLVLDALQGHGVSESPHLPATEIKTSNSPVPPVSGPSDPPVIKESDSPVPRPTRGRKAKAASASQCYGLRWCYGVTDLASYFSFYFLDLVDLFVMCQVSLTRYCAVLRPLYCQSFGQLSSCHFATLCCALLRTTAYSSHSYSSNP